MPAAAVSAAAPPHTAAAVRARGRPLRAAARSASAPAPAAAPAVPATAHHVADAASTARTTAPRSGAHPGHPEAALSPAPARATSGARNSPVACTPPPATSGGRAPAPRPAASPAATPSGAPAGPAASSRGANGANGAAGATGRPPSAAGPPATISGTRAPGPPPLRSTPAGSTPSSAVMIRRAAPGGHVSWTNPATALRSADVGGRAGATPAPGGAAYVRRRLISSVSPRAAAGSASARRARRCALPAAVALSATGPRHAAPKPGRPVPVSAATSARASRCAACSSAGRGTSSGRFSMTASLRSGTPRAPVRSACRTAGSGSTSS
ncbi:hypothetical protein [Streptomyces sp. MAR4 CNX-425]|uniref:hypothetical protein n=1 Tax=Streptomyces sp. MAR4 CNX-425 TaxID=3406343 RepID=UPI003B514847